MADRERLAAVVITKNEEARIARCLESVRWADELIVVDSMSTDRTVEICKSYGAKVISEPFSGSFGEERNKGSDGTSCEWVLQLDADDVVSNELADKIHRFLREGTPHAAYHVRRKNNFMGQWMLHGGWYHYYCTLYRRSACRFKGRVHHTLNIEGTTGRLDAAVLHFPFRNFEEFVARHNRYTSIEAQELNDGPDAIPWPAIRYQLTWRTLKLFWKSYIKKQGFRDGWYGLVFASLYAWVNFLKWAKCHELSENKKEGSL